MTPRSRRAAGPASGSHLSITREGESVPGMPDEGLTGAVEDYLKAIYDIELGGNAAATNDLAQRLGVVPASVSGMVRRLADHGLLAHEPYRGVRLTPRGRQAALRTLRRHRVIEAYLTQALGYPWDRVHAEAERLEHAASDELIDRMARAIGDPPTDPHGAPIPTRDGGVDETEHRAMLEMAVGERARVSRVRDEDPALLRYLAELDLRPGMTVHLVARAPFGGPLTVEVGDRQHVIGEALAAEIAVE